MPTTPAGTGQPNSGPAPTSPPASKDSPPAQRTSRRRSLATSVNACPVPPPYRFDDVLTAVLDTVVTTYTRTGDRVLLAAPGTARRSRSQDRDRIAEAVRLLGREPATARRTPNGSGPGTGPNGLGGPDRTAVDRDQTGPVPPADRSGDAGAPPDRVSLIIAAQGVDTALLADWARLLTPDGTLLVLTHSDESGSVPITRTHDLIFAAGLAGLTLTDRLIFVHDTPSATRPASDLARRRITLGAHHRVHTDALVLTPTTLMEASHA